MRTEAFYSVWNAEEIVCSECGRTYLKTPEWAYYGYADRYRRIAVCSWSCVRKNEKRREKEAADKAAEKRAKRLMAQRPANHFLTEDEKALIRLLYSQGWPAGRICEITGRPKDTVYRIIRSGCGKEPE